MKEKTLFLKRFLKHYGTVGSITPSSKFLVNKVIEMVPFKNAKCLVELGAGTGVLSDALLRNKKKETRLMMLEPDAEFFPILKKKFSKEENVEVIQEVAENLPDVLKKKEIKKVDCIISSLPFVSLGNKITEKIISIISNVLADGGYFVFYQYTPFRIPLILRYFQIERFSFTALNAPPAFVFLCSARRSNS